MSIHPEGVTNGKPIVQPIGFALQIAPNVTDEGSKTLKTRG